MSSTTRPVQKDLWSSASRMFFQSGHATIASVEDADTDLIRRCLLAVVEGPFVDEWEFHTLFGLTRVEVAEVLQAWPRRLSNTDLAVDNALGHLVGCPHGMRPQVLDWTGADEATLHKALERRRGEGHFSDP